MATILVVDDHELFRSGVKVLINTMGNIDIIEASDGQECIEVLKHTTPDVILMDINMPNMDGIEATKKALSENSDLKILILSMFDDSKYYNTLIDLGVKGFLLKDSNVEELKNGIQSVLEGRSYFSQQLLLNLIKNKDTGSNVNLTEREIEVLNLIAKGHSTQEISDLLFISFRTVERHRSNLFLKTETNSTLKLLVYSIKNGLVEI